MPDLCIVICTHNRRELLRRTLFHLEQAIRPPNQDVEVLVIANACADGTAEWLESRAAGGGRLPMRWLEEPRKGKAHTLNRAVEEISAHAIAIVDDDHRVGNNYLGSILSALTRYPEATIFCGRIMPDWDGTEPAWAHDNGPYRIYPLPVPEFDLGPEEFEIMPGKRTPGGGNLAIRRGVFDRVGRFATELGPRGHDLGGGEDSDFVQRALSSGERLRYVPSMLQYHHINPLRFRLGYLLRKAYQRSRAVVRISGEPGRKIHAYLWRKMVVYAFNSMVSLSWARRRFYMVRVASVLGEMRGWRDKKHA